MNTRAARAWEDVASFVSKSQRERTVPVGGYVTSPWQPPAGGSCQEGISYVVGLRTSSGIRGGLNPPLPHPSLSSCTCESSTTRAVFLLSELPPKKLLFCLLFLSLSPFLAYGF